MGEPIRRTFGDAVAGRRRVLGLTQRDLAARTSLSPQYLCDIENGRREPVTVATIHCLAAALDHSADDLFFLAGRLPPDLARAVMLAGPEQCAAALDAFRAALRPQQHEEQAHG